MKAAKWNYEKHEYEDYELPDGAVAYCSDLETVCKCASCGKDITYGEGYTSLEIHVGKGGMGCCVCEECYDEEFERYRKYKSYKA